MSRGDGQYKDFQASIGYQFQFEKQFTHFLFVIFVHRYQRKPVIFFDQTHHNQSALYRDRIGLHEQLVVQAIQSGIDGPRQSLAFAQPNQSGRQG